MLVTKGWCSSPCPAAPETLLWKLRKFTPVQKKRTTCNGHLFDTGLCRLLSMLFKRATFAFYLPSVAPSGALRPTCFPHQYPVSVVLVARHTECCCKFKVNTKVGAVEAQGKAKAACRWWVSLEDNQVSWLCGFQQVTAKCQPSNVKIYSHSHKCWLWGLNYPKKW